MAVVVAGVAAACASSGSDIYIDTAYRDGVPAVDGWNRLRFYETGSTSLVGTNGAPSGVSLTVTTPVEGRNASGAASPEGEAAIFAVAAPDNAFGSDTNPQGTAVFSGLDPGTPCTFTFYGSRIGVADNRETRFVLVGSSTTSVALDPANNLSRVAVTPDLFPTPAGQITLQVGKGPSNSNSSGFYYVAAIRLSLAARGLRIRDVGGGAGGQGIILTWTSSSGTLYEVSRSTNLADPLSWAVIADDIVAGGETVTWTNPAAPAAAAAYYRVGAPGAPE